MKETPGKKDTKNERLVKQIKDKGNSKVKRLSYSFFFCFHVLFSVQCSQEVAGSESKAKQEELREAIVMSVMHSL